MASSASGNVPLSGSERKAASALMALSRVRLSDTNLKSVRIGICTTHPWKLGSFLVVGMHPHLRRKRTLRERQQRTWSLTSLVKLWAKQWKQITANRQCGAYVTGFKPCINQLGYDYTTSTSTHSVNTFVIVPYVFNQTKIFAARYVSNALRNRPCWAVLSLLFSQGIYP